MRARSLLSRQEVERFIFQPSLRKGMIITVIVILGISSLAQILPEGGRFDPHSLWGELLLFLGHPGWQKMAGIITLLAAAITIYERFRASEK